MKKYYRSIFYVIVIVAVSVSFMPVTGFGQDQAGLTGSDECAKCHANEKKLYDTHAHSKMKEGGVENGVGIGCETCHGPGKAHSDMGLAELQKVKKAKGDMNIRGKADNTESELCASCHMKNANNDIDIASDYLLVGLQQYSEIARSKKATMNMTCTMCHDSHGTSKDQKAMKRKCLDCHVGDKWGKPVKIKAMADLSCESCHMPYAVSGDQDKMVNEYQKGTTRSHIFGISIDKKYELNDGADHVTLTKDENYARLTVEMTCYACHKSGEAHDMSREQMLKKARKVH